MLSSLKGKDILGGMSKETYISGLQKALQGGKIAVSEFNQSLSSNELKKFSILVRRGSKSINDFDSYVKTSSQGLKGWASSFAGTAKSMALNMGAMIAITAAIKVAAWAFDELNVTLEEQQEVVDALSTKISALKDEYAALSEKKDKTKDDEDQLKYLERQLEVQEKLYKVEKKRLADKDLYGTGDILSKGNLKDLTPKSYGHTNEVYDLGQSNNIESEINRLEDARKRIAESSNVNTAKYWDKEQEKSIVSLKKYREELLADWESSADSYNRIKKYLDDGTYDDDQEKVKELRAEMAGYKADMDELQGLTNDIEKSINNTDFYDSEVFKTLEKDLKGLLSQGKLTADTLADNKYAELNDLMKSLGVTVEDLVDKLKKVSDSEVAISPLTSAVDEYSNAISALPSQLAEIEDVQSKVNDGYSFSYDEIEKLKSKYPDLEKAIYRTVDGWGIEKEAVDLLHTSTGELGDQYLNVQKAMTEALNSDMAVRLSNLGIELEGIKTIADAYAEIAKARKSAGSTSLPEGVSGATLPSSSADFKKLIGITTASQDVIDYGKTVERFGELQNKLKDLRAGRVSGGSPSKSKSSTKEDYKAEIDKYKELSDAVEAVRESIEKLKLDYDNTDSLEEQIKIKEQLITLYEDEKKALDALNTARDVEIAQNAEKLRKAGFQVEYDPASDSLQIKNREHLNFLSQKTIKEYEDLIKKTDDLNDANKENAKQWMELGYTISGAAKEIDKLKSDQYDAYIEDAEHSIELLSNRNDSIGKSISIIQDMMEQAAQRRNDLIAKGYEANKKAIQKLESDWISYYDRRIEAEKKVLESQKESKDATINAVTSLLDDQIKSIDDQIKALQKLNDERKEALDLQKAQELADKAKEQRTKSVLRKGQGYVYEADQDAIKEAQENLADIKFNSQVTALEKEKEALEDYKKLWSEIPNLYEKYQNELKAEQLLGANWEDKISDMRLSTYKNFKDDYFDLQDDIASKTDELNNHLNEQYIQMVNTFQQMAALMGKSPTSGSIESMMSESDKAVIKAAQSAYNTAKAQGNKTAMDSAHSMAESIRDKYRTGSTLTSDITSTGTPVTNASNTTSYTKQPYELVSTTQTGGNSGGGNSSLKAEYERQLSLAKQYGGSDAYKSRLESAIAREVSGAGHTIETYNNGTTTSTIVKATNQAEATMSADEIRKKNEASVKNNTNSLDKVNSGLKGNTNATEYAGDAMYDASDTISESVKSAAESNKETANSFASAISSFVGSLGSSSSDSGSSKSNSRVETGSSSSSSSAFSAVKKLASSATSAVKSVVSKLTSSKKKASGGINLSADTYNTDELGDELKIEPQQGNWVTVTNGTSILPADISRNLMDFGSDPTAYLRQMSANQIAGVTRIQNTNTAPITHVSIAKLETNLPGVKNVMEFMEELNNLPQLLNQYNSKS
jgi:hypothetical protein